MVKCNNSNKALTAFEVCFDCCCRSRYLLNCLNSLKPHIWSWLPAWFSIRFWQHSTDLNKTNSENLKQIVARFVSLIARHPSYLITTQSTLNNRQKRRKKHVEQSFRMRTSWEAQFKEVSWGLTSKCLNDQRDITLIVRFSFDSTRSHSLAGSAIDFTSWWFMSFVCNKSVTHTFFIVAWSSWPTNRIPSTIWISFTSASASCETLSLSALSSTLPCLLNKTEADDLKTFNNILQESVTERSRSKGK